MPLDHALTSLKAEGRLVINRIILLKVQCRPRLAKALESVIQFAMVLSLETTFGTKNKPLRGDARNTETGTQKLSATLG